MAGVEVATAVVAVVAAALVAVVVAVLVTAVLVIAAAVAAVCLCSSMWWAARDDLACEVPGRTGTGGNEVRLCCCDGLPESNDLDLDRVSIHST